jgi:hypothetical protein
VSTPFIMSTQGGIERDDPREEAPPLPADCPIDHDWRAEVLGVRRLSRPRGSGCLA